MTKKETAEKIKKLIEIKRKVAKLEAEKKELTAEITHAMGDHPGAFTFYGQKLASLSLVTRENFNKAQFQEDYPDLYSRYISTSESLRLNA